MTKDELGVTLKKMYENAQGDVSSQILLFGIKYANEIKSDCKDIVHISGVPKSYATDIHKGIKLAKHVVVKTASQ